MLLTNPIGGRFDPAIPSSNGNPHFHWAEFSLPESPDHWITFAEDLHKSQIKPMAFSAPLQFNLGGHFHRDEWNQLFHTFSPLLTPEYPFLICRGTTVTLKELFTYLDDHPRDFHAFQDYKSHYVDRIINQLQDLVTMAKAYGIQVILENAPMGSPFYFEPGQGHIHPALRTPRHLRRIAKATGVKLCFDTAYARITSNALTYMNQSRSLFAGATEKEIQHAPADWNQFFSQVKSVTALIRLSSSLSWGDSPETCHIPFRPDTESELRTFLKQVSADTPILLPFRQENQWQEWNASLARIAKL
ncbi:hypothetical protein [Marininema halotolerans]|uniref:Xylose isomerase-like TIM barrel n=1 Tax=Marininema halotolerans TaxID=1155944 RepID=A0A1I6SYG7_9BACL|nr:hypothetical protein [Marininema halotolerans]SFS81923.1 hypothetical protein SAMN05444972_108125 [Marininema halotolerans]